MAEEKIMEKSWENIQKKTFTGWVNNHLRKRGLVVQNLETDLEDGLKLIALLEIISDDVFSYKYDKRPKLRIQKVGNVGYCLQFIKNKGVNLAGVGAEEIVDGNLKMILGMIWTIILRFQIQDISMEDLSAKEGLLLWCQKKTAGYDGVNVKNFHMSFQDGLAFCALINKHRPDLLDYDKLDKSNKAACLETAFDVAEKSLDIPRLLDVSDMLDMPKPDERSVMTYVSLYYHVFASSQKAEAAGRRVGKLLDFTAQNEKLKSDYLDRAKRLLDWINQTTSAMGDREFDNTLEGVEGKINDFKSYKTQDKPPKYNEKVELEALISGLQTKLAVNNRSPFVPPAGLSSHDIDASWAALDAAEHARLLALRYELRRMQRILHLVKKFNQLAGKIEAWSKERSVALKSSDYGETISAVQAKLKNLDAFESEYVAQNERVTALHGIAAQLSELKYHDQSTIDARDAEVTGGFSSLRGDSDARRQALEAHLAHLQQIENLLLEFAQRGIAFRVWLENAEDTLTDPIFGEYVEDIKEYQNAYDTFTAERSSKEAEFASLGELASNCQQLGVSETTFSDVSWSSLQQGWSKIESLVGQRQADIAAELQRQNHNEDLRKHFAALAIDFNKWGKDKSAQIESLSGDLQAQINANSAIIQEINGAQAKFHEVVAAQQALEDARVNDNQHTELTVEGLKSQWDALNVLSHKKQQVLEKELLAQSGTGLSADQLAEFKECFKHFDKDLDNLLDRLELGSCLKSLGEDINYDAGGKLDQILAAIDGDNDGKVTFDEFASYMERVSSGSDTPDSIKQAFKILAGDKDFVTEADLRSVLPAEKVDYCLAHMQKYPGVDNAYDYNSFTDNLYSN
jgi:actinin alpha